MDLIIIIIIIIIMLRFVTVLVLNFDWDPEGIQYSDYELSLLLKRRTFSCLPL